MPTFNAGEIRATATLDRTPFQRNLDSMWRAGKEFDRATFTATLDANTKPFYRALQQASKAGQGFESREYKAQLGADRTMLARNLRRAAADVNQFRRSVSKSQLDIDTGALNQALRIAERDAAKSGIVVANNFSSPFRKIKWGLIFAGLTAAASAVPVSLYAITTALGSVVGAMAPTVSAFTAFNDAQDALASGSADAAERVAAFEDKMSELTPAGRAFVAQALSMRDELDAFNDVMQDRVLPGVTGFLDGVESAAPVITGGFGQIGAAMGDVAAYAGELMRSPVFQGQLEDAFANATPVARSFGLTLVNLLRDMTEFAAVTPEIGIGLANMLDSTSSGFDRFFSNLSGYGPEVGRLFAELGSTVELFLGHLGTFAGEVAGTLGPALGVLNSAADQVMGTFNALAAGVLPGVGSAVSGVMATIGGLATVLGPIAPLIGGITGQLAPFVIAIKAIDTLSFGRISGEFRSLRENIDAVEGRAKKARTALSGLADIGLGPAGIAAGLLGAALMALGNAQMAAAERAAAHEERVRSLTDAILEDEGAIGEATRTTITKTLADQDAARRARELGIAYTSVVGASLNHKDALDSTIGSIDAQMNAIYAQDDATKQFIGSQDQLIGLMNRHGDTAEELVWKQLSLAEANGTLSEKDIERAANLLNLRHAIQQNSGEVAKAEQAALELAAAENGVSVATMQHYNALLVLNSELLSSIDKDLAYRQSVLSLEQAHKAAADALDTHSATSEEYRAAALQEEQAIMGVINAKGQQVLATSKATGAESKQVEATKAMYREALQLAGTYEGPLPKALETYIAGMDVATATAIGATIATNKAGEAVYKLPNGKEIKITAPGADAAIEKARQLKAALDLIKSKTITITTNNIQRYSTQGTRLGTQNSKGEWVQGGGGLKDGGLASSAALPRYNVGGQVQGYPDGGLIRGPGGPRTDSIPLLTSAGMILSSTSEYIVRASQTAKYLPVLEAINSGAQNLREVLLTYALREAPLSSPLSSRSSAALATAPGAVSGGTPIRQVARTIADAVSQALVTGSPASTGRAAPVIGSITLQTARDGVSSALDEVLFRARHAGKGLYDG